MKPKILWEGFGIDDEGKERREFPIRIVEVSKSLVLEVRRTDAMGEPSWQGYDMEQNWLLRALVKGTVR